MPCRHPLHRLARTQHAAGDVDRHHTLDALGRHVLDPRRRPDDAGIVDERTQRTEPIGRLEQRENVLFARDIAFHRDRLAVPGLDRRDDLIRRRLVARIATDDAIATRRGGKCRGPADAAAAAGDDHNLIGQICPRSSGA
jgi:hypothetical protein